MIGVRNLLLLLIYPFVEPVWGFAPILPRRPEPFLSPTYSSASSVDELDFAFIPKGERTFYDILGVSPNASKVELKQSYIKLARVTHPDALIGSNSTGGDTSTEFSEIARAWKVLSNEKDRRRYDRSLVAEDFKKNVEKVASSVVETAAPRVKKAFDDFAMPFLRRTTVTTVATVSAAVDTFGNGDRLNLGSAVASGMKAAQAAGRVVDGIEFLEKCRELEVRAANEIEKADKIKSELNAIVDKRLDISLITPNSGLSAKDALKILNKLNATDSITMMERMISMKHTIERDITDLEVIENEYFEKLADQTDTAEKVRFTQVALKQAARDAKQAAQDEIIARRALEEAQKRLATTKLNVNDLSKSFSKIQAVEAKVNFEVESVAESMAKRQETIRKALRKKKREIEAERRKQNDIAKSAHNDVDEGDNPESIVAIEKFREQESVLQRENDRLEEMVARLISRAEKLKKRAELLENVKAQD